VYIETVILAYLKIMKKKYQPTSKEDLYRISTNARIILEEGDETSPVTISGKAFDAHLDLGPIDNFYHRKVRPLVFVDCHFKVAVELSKPYEYGRIEFKNCVFDLDVSINWDSVRLSGECEFNEDLTIGGVSRSLIIKNIQIGGSLYITGELSQLKLDNINGNLKEVGAIVICGSIEALYIFKVYVDTLRFENRPSFKHLVMVTYSKISQFLANGFFLETGLELSNCTIGNLSFYDTIGENKYLDVRNCTIGTLHLDMTVYNTTRFCNNRFSEVLLFNANHSESLLNIEKSNVDFLNFESLHNKGQITLRQLSIPKHGKLSFRSSTIGKMDFIRCDFSVGSFEFENSKITEAFLSETDFPKQVCLDDKINYKQAQLAFGQSATAFQKQGDNIRSLEYSAREVESHYKSIALFSKHFSTKINLWLNLVSNDFGRDWVRGSVFSFTVGLIFFCCLLVSTDRFSIGFPSVSLDLLPAYLKFMNPFRFFELKDIFSNTAHENNIKLSRYSYLADFVGRIFIAYGFYQTIQAFRRFGRSGR